MLEKVIPGFRGYLLGSVVRDEKNYILIKWVLNANVQPGIGLHHKGSFVPRVR